MFVQRGIDNVFMLSGGLAVCVSCLCGYYRAGRGFFSVYPCTFASSPFFFLSLDYEDKKTSAYVYVANLFWLFAGLRVMLQKFYRSGVVLGLLL